MKWITNNSPKLLTQNNGYGMWMWIWIDLGGFGWICFNLIVVRLPCVSETRQN
jgi:hypothetical protein